MTIPLEVLSQPEFPDNLANLSGYIYYPGMANVAYGTEVLTQI